MKEPFKANRQAWDNFQGMASSYHQAVAGWVVSARQKATPFKRLQIMIADIR